MTPPAEPHDWLQTLFDESPLAIGFSRDGVTLDANPAYAHLFGYDSATELRGRSLLEQIAPSHRDQVLAMVTQRARGEALPELYQTRGLRKDGTEFPLEVTTTRVMIADGPLTIAFISDVSERERALGALTASEERFRTLSSGAFEGVFVHADGNVALANEVGAAMYGYDAASVVGVPLMDLTAPESRGTVAEQVRRRAAEPYEGIALRRDGSTFVAEVRGTTLSHQGKPMRVTVIRDVTDRKRREAEQHALTERVRQAQKLESLGVLAGGVAHDFNNILTVISNGIALTKREPGLGRAALEHLEGVTLAAEHAADLCRQMLAYTGRARLERETLELSALVDGMSSMLEASIAKKATLVRELPAGLPALLADATQVRQIAMNLVLNAAEAISGAQGVIRVSTGAGTFAAAAFVDAVVLGAPSAGVYVWLEVQDNGAGMKPETVAQMFDPFFTTKFVGRGLGMAAVAGIVRSHGGAVEVDSKPGHGTRVRVLLPASDAAPVVHASPPPAEEPQRRGVVLVIDDEKNVRTSIGLLLRAHGFEALLASDGAEAIASFEAERHRIDVVLLDLTMPGMNGIQVLEALRRIAPEVPVVLTSGYGATRLDDEPKGGAGPDAVLSKPYSVDRLLETLRRVMKA